MKAFLFGFFAVYALLGVANADDAKKDRPPRDVYVGAYCGGNWNDIISTPIANTQAGYLCGGVLGVSVPAVPGLHFELDGSFSKNEVKLFGGALNVDHDTTALLVNARYQFPLDFPVRPYALVGAGYGHSEATLENISIISVESSGLAWQLGTGVNARVADGVTVGLGYRFRQAQPLEVLGTELSDGTNHSVLAELLIAL